MLYRIKNHMRESISWSSFEEFEKPIDKFLPEEGEGDTFASQLATAISKLVYKWFNDGDVPDNVHSFREYGNDLSSYANWINEYYDHDFYDRYCDCYTKEDYTKLLYSMVEGISKSIADYSDKPKEESIYDCTGDFEFRDSYDDEDEGDDDNYRESSDSIVDAVFNCIYDALKEMGFKRRVHISIQKNEDETIDATITKFSNKLNTRRLFDILHKEVMSSPFFTDVSWQVDEDESLGWKVNPHPKSLTFNFCVLK